MAILQPIGVIKTLQLPEDANAFQHPLYLMDLKLHTKHALVKWKNSLKSLQVCDVFCLNICTAIEKNLSVMTANGP